MTDVPAALPDRVVAFLRSRVDSMLQLEALLLVFEAAPDTRDAAGIGLQMYLSESVISSWLDEFVRGGLCERGAVGYRLVADDETIKLVGEVADAYTRRPVSVGRCIFAQAAPDPRRSLAEAFRLRPKRVEDH